MLQHTARLCALLTCAPWAFAGDFSLTIGSPVAANVPVAKGAIFVVRLDSCAEPAKAQMTGVAEGVVNGARRSVALKLMALSTPGVYAISQQWAAEGAWVVNLTGSCLGETASALVPIGPKGFIRESAKFFPRLVKQAEIEASLKALAASQAGNTSGGTK